MHTVNQWQLFDLQNSPEDNLLHPAPDTYLPIMLMQKLLNTKVPQVTHPYGTWSKTKVDSAPLTTSYEDEKCSGVIGNCLTESLKNYGGKQVGYL